MKLAGLIYNDNTKEKIAEMGLVEIINETFDDNKEENEYFKNAIYILGIICLEYKNLSEDVINTKLLDKIMKKINLNIIEQKEPTYE